MYSIENPFRLEQGDVSFDSPDTVTTALNRALTETRTHSPQTTGVPRLRDLIAAKLRDKNQTPVEDSEDVLVTNGGIHGLYIACHALLEPGDEVIVPDPVWPPTTGNILAARAVPVPCPLHESKAWRYDLDELASTVGPKTRAIYLNSPQNPTGGVLTRDDIVRIAALARERDLWVFSDEAYEDVLFEGEHVSIASLPDMYERTIPIYTFSKSYAMTGLRLGYVAIRNAKTRERAKKVLFYTASNIASVVQFGGIGALEGPQDCIEQFRTELRARRDLFYDGISRLGTGVFSGKPPAGAFYAFLKIDPQWTDPASHIPSPSWKMTEYLIKHGRIGSVPGVDFGRSGEGYVRFCFARDRKELAGALESMQVLFSPSAAKLR
jgi:aspartate aminotransferase